MVIPPPPSPRLHTPAPSPPPLVNQIDDSDGYISDEDYIDHDEEVTINESLQEVMVELDKERFAVDMNYLPVDKYKDIEQTIDNIQPIIVIPSYPIHPIPSVPLFL